MQIVTHLALVSAQLPVCSLEYAEADSALALAEMLLDLRCYGYESLYSNAVRISKTSWSHPGAVVRCPGIDQR